MLRKQHSHQVKVSFYRLDPATNKLAIYNNLERRIREFDLSVINTDGDEYKLHVDSLKAQDGIIVPLNDIKNNAGISFNGEIKVIKAYTSTGVERFVLKGNYFKRH